jgi:four helix bundle protein
MENIEITKPKTFDLELRTEEFAKRCRKFIREIVKDICNIEDGKQLTRSSGSVGANYIEANESLSKKDFIMRIKICRKESKESRYWLKLINTDNNPTLTTESLNLIQKSSEIMKIFGSILIKSQTA